jgi:hypothetical protein
MTMTVEDLCLFLARSLIFEELRDIYEKNEALVWLAAGVYAGAGIDPTAGGSCRGSTQLRQLSGKR